MKRPLLSRLVLCAITAMCIAQACDPNKPATKPPTDDQSVADAGASAPSADAGLPDAGMTKHKEPEAGSLKPADAGPPGPALFLLSGLKGYTEPCGCTADILLGGLDRIVGYVEAARALYPGHAMIDAGDWLFEEPHLAENRVAQEKRKSDVLVAAYKKLGIQVTVPGVNDLALGVDYYKERVAAAGMTPVAVNLKLGGQALEGSRLLELGGLKVGVIGAVDPALFAGIEGVEAAAPQAGIAAAIKRLEGQGAQVLVLVMKGEQGATKSLMEANPALDFGVIGHKPRETDQADESGKGHTLELYDQGRYLGILKLWAAPGSKDFVSAQAGSAAELETVGRQIIYVEESIQKLPPASQGEEPPMLKSLRDRLVRLKQRQEEIKSSKIEVPEGESAFLWRSIAMTPGYPIDAQIEAERRSYNRELKQISASLDVKVVEAKPGEAFYVGEQQCATCHQAAAKVWEGTHHAGAFATLVERDKDFDQACVGCHVVGYEKPGGSALGKWQYPGTVGEYTFDKDLRNVGCESCHGPGSLHMGQPVGADGKPQHINRASSPEVCAQCHVSEHSPRFNYDVYVQQITGPGHARRAP
jgi:hypothetical protein